jgi:hypothetical protein
VWVLWCWIAFDVAVWVAFDVAVWVAFDVAVRVAFNVSNVALKISLLEKVFGFVSSVQSDTKLTAEFACPRQFESEG